MDYTPEVLKNNGVSVQIAQLRDENGEWKLIYNEEGELETETLWIKFTHNTIADIEEVWDSLPEWQEAMANKPISTLRRTIGLIKAEPVEKIGLRLIEGQINSYSNAIGAAWGLANGVDPTVASRLLSQAEAAADSQVEMINQELTEALDEAEEDILGNTQSQHGANQDKPSTDSGKQAQPKS
tara:strand:+ start:4273 stop:4821 length:549 start_codon:yes stop_codon:yes gene_type:complete